MEGVCLLTFIVEESVDWLVGRWLLCTSVFVLFLFLLFGGKEVAWCTYFRERRRRIIRPMMRTARDTPRIGYKDITIHGINNLWAIY